LYSKSALVANCTSEQPLTRDGWMEDSLLFTN